MGPELILLLVTLACWSAGFVLSGRFLPGARAGARGPVRTVSVIVPARNEEHNLPALFRSLASQPMKPREIIVVDDSSTDRTAEVARQLGATVVAAKPLPDDWRGKPWACHQGAAAVTSELLLFVDADAWFQPEGFARILSTYAGGAFSLGPYHEVRELYEELSLFFNLNMSAGTVPHGLFGQMLLVDRDSYQRVGGHAAVKGRTLENFFLARQFRAAGIPTRSAVGRGVLSFRMYPHGLRELVEGWTKGFASGAGRTPVGTMFLIVLWMIGLMLAPLSGLWIGDWLRWGPVYLVCAAQVAWFSRQLGSFRWLTALLYPVPLVFFFVVFAWSVLRSGQRVRWKGREIRAD